MGVNIGQLNQPSKGAGLHHDPDRLAPKTPETCRSCHGLIVININTRPNEGIMGKRALWVTMAGRRGENYGGCESPVMGQGGWLSCVCRRGSRTMSMTSDVYSRSRPVSIQIYLNRVRLY